MLVHIREHRREVIEDYMSESMRLFRSISQPLEGNRWTTVHSAAG